MGEPKKKSRLALTLAALGLIGAALAAAFWPHSELVDLGAITQGPMTVTIDEEGRTQVAEPYVVSTPVAGQLQRVEVDPGDWVRRGETIVARMRPTNPAALDVRTLEQARAAVAAAEAALSVARADLNAAAASREFADTELKRVEQLVARNIKSASDLDRARRDVRVAVASHEMAIGAIAMREADLANAKAMLISFEDDVETGTVGAREVDGVPVLAPTDGRVLRVIQRSETTLPAGAPILEIGNVDDDLEVVVELISSDAVQVKLLDRVLIEDWGGGGALIGEVVQIDPFGVTKVSALGVEEQRVPVTVALKSPPEERRGLGHGYRIEARIVVWRREDALRIPSSALFRSGDGWAVFVDDDGVARKRDVQIGQSNGVEAEALGGVAEGESVVLYPSAAVADGVSIAPRTVN